MELTDQEKQEIAQALKRESQRLRGTLADYMKARPNLKQPAVKAMAEEGASNVQERATKLDDLADKVLGIKPEDSR